MLQSGSQKMKLLLMYAYLREETDENHPATTGMIVSALEQRGLSCDRKTVGSEIELLNGAGFEIMTGKSGRENAYYVADRTFSDPELRILIDAVGAASFITEKKTGELMRKIASLGGKNLAEDLENGLVPAGRCKHTNEKIYYSVSALEDALRRRTKVSFRYFDLDYMHKKRFRKNRDRYIAEPVSLIFSEDNYYLTALSADHEGLVCYRIDRMEDVAAENEGIGEKALLLAETAAAYPSEAFRMYGGEICDVELEFTADLLGAVYDRFGEKTEMQPRGSGNFAVVRRIRVSPVFYGWIFQFGGKMRILSPEKVRAEYENMKNGRTG